MVLVGLTELDSRFKASGGGLTKRINRQAANIQTIRTTSNIDLYTSVVPKKIMHDAVTSEIGLTSPLLNEIAKRLWTRLMRV